MARKKKEGAIIDPGPPPVQIDYEEYVEVEALQDAGYPVRRGLMQPIADSSNEKVFKRLPNGKIKAGGAAIVKGEKYKVKRKYLHMGRNPETKSPLQLKLFKVVA